MISPGTRCRECGFKVSTEVDMDLCIATCPSCRARYVVIVKGRHDLETGETWNEINLGNRLEDIGK